MYSLPLNKYACAFLLLTVHFDSYVIYIFIQVAAQFISCVYHLIFLYSLIQSHCENITRTVQTVYGELEISKY